MSGSVQPSVRIECGDALDLLRREPDESIDCIVTSPPYWHLRDYGCEGQIGLEETPEAYVSRLVAVFREVRRVLRCEGTCWINLGDSYAGSSMTGGVGRGTIHGSQQGDRKGGDLRFAGKRDLDGLKPKDLVGIPWRVAFALQDDGWWLRSDIVWCLSGGTHVYARTQKGDMPMTVKDLARLDPLTVRLWNGQRWTQLLGVSSSHRKGDEIEIVLRSGERISCTPTHRFPCGRGVVEARELRVGDTLQSARLPEPDAPRDCSIDEDAAWLAGLYVAEGSMSGDTIQIAGHAREEARWARLQGIAARFGGYATCSVKDNTMTVRLYGKVLNALLSELVTGRTAKDKGFAPAVWRYSNAFLRSMVDGYLSGDGGWDESNGRWRLGFTRNYNLERDLRTACARLGYALTLNLASVPYNGKEVPTFRGELRTAPSGHHNAKDRNEIVSIRKARCRMVYDLGVADEPHLFCLASGVLTHNSKPNPMPESVTDRPTRAHEYVFLLTKAARYWYDADAIAEDAIHAGRVVSYDGTQKTTGHENRTYPGAKPRDITVNQRRNARSVWNIATQPFPEAHFATFPEELARRCILAGCPEGGTVLDPFGGSGTVGAVAARFNRNAILFELNPAYCALARRRVRPETQPRMDLEAVRP